MRFLRLLLLLVVANVAVAQPALGPTLGAASNFGQTWQPDLLAAAEAEGIADLRDEIHWDGVEIGGKYQFSSFITQYPALLAAREMGMTLIVNETHPDYDSGVIPHSPQGVAALARFVTELAHRFSAIEAIEVGNEMNSETFTSGPMRAADLAGRASYYTAILRAVHDAARAVRPDLRIIGGAAHSIPLAWFTGLSTAGAADLMDSVALHPYTTPAEQFVRQVALLRQVRGFETMPIEVTEVGSRDAMAAPAVLLKNYCQMALSGVTRAVWYPLGARGDGLAPLLNENGVLTDVGRTFQLIQRELAGQPVADAAPDPFTYGCRFGERGLVLWGAPRSVTLADPNLRVVGPTGAPVGTPRLSRETPMLILSTGPAARLGETVQLGPQTVIADTFDQFAYPGQGGDPFERFARVGDEILPFVLGPGQETNGVPWTPYLRNPRDGLLRMNAEFLMPSRAASGAIEIVHAYRAPEDIAITLDAMLEPDEKSRDGVVLSVLRNGHLLEQPTVVTARTVLTYRRIDLARGDLLEIVVGPGASSENDASLYRFTLSQAGIR